jgi:hypothetical protein
MPAEAAAEQDFMAWFKQQLWSRKAPKMEPTKRHQEILRRLSSTRHAEVLARLRSSLDEMWANDAETTFSLAGLGQLLQRLHLGLHSLSGLTVKERIRILSALGHPMPNTAAPETTFIDWLRQQFRQLLASNPSEARTQSLRKLASTAFSDTMNSIRLQIEEHTDQDEPPFTLETLDQMLKHYGLDIDDLEYLRLDTLTRLMSKLGLISESGARIRFTKSEILQRLHRKFWYSRVLTRCPQGSQLEILEKLAEPRRCTDLDRRGDSQQSSSTDDEDHQFQQEQDAEFFMEFDMHVPTNPLGDWHWMQNETQHC